MTDHPIIFDAESVRALLAGRKTQTRRIIKPPPTDDWSPRIGYYHPTCLGRDGEEYPGPETYGASDADEGRRCPWHVGQRLWVKETCVRFTGLPDAEDRPWPIDAPWRYSPERPESYNALLPVAGNEGSVRLLREAAACATVSPIYMPRWASRITLEVVGVKVERVVEISDADIMEEGCPIEYRSHGGWRWWWKERWCAIHGIESWEASPWVWAITFRTVET